MKTQTIHTRTFYQHMGQWCAYARHDTRGFETPWPNGRGSNYYSFLIGDKVETYARNSLTGRYEQVDPLLEPHHFKMESENLGVPVEYHPKRPTGHGRYCNIFTDNHN